MKEKFSMKKLYYSISEVSKITELEQYVLRYWETEFEQLKPAKNLAGNRIYTNKDIKLILYIKRLLRDEKYTIEGAKKLLKTYNFRDEQQEEQKPAEKKKYPSPFLHREPKQSKELSLFNSESRKEEQDEPGKTEIRRDLRELRNFLTELLDDID